MPLDFQYDHLLLARSELKPVRDAGETIGYRISIGYPNYRGTFLSCIERLEIRVDGQPVAKEDIRLTLNGKEFLIENLGELCHEYWFVRDSMGITILRDGGIAPGEHGVRVEMTHRIPYTGYFGQYLTIHSVCEERLTLAEGA